MKKLLIVLMFLSSMSLQAQDTDVAFQSCIVVYEQPNFQGRSEMYCDAGNFNLPFVVRSIRVPSGFVLRGWEGEFQQDYTANNGSFILGSYNTAITVGRIEAVPLALYRLRNGDRHFYTIDAAERDNATARLGYVSEGIVCNVINIQQANTLPLFRLRNGDRHFYTIDVAERDNATTRLGYVSEGIACYVFPTQITRSIPLYRLRNGNRHFYTTNVTERDNATSRLGYVSEGIACYVLPQ